MGARFQVAELQVFEVLACGVCDTIQGWALNNPYLSHSLNSLKGGYIGDYMRDYHRGVIMGDTRSLDHSSFRVFTAFSIAPRRSDCLACPYAPLLSPHTLNPKLPRTCYTIVVSILFSIIPI